MHCAHVLCVCIAFVHCVCVLRVCIACVHCVCVLHACIVCAHCMFLVTTQPSLFNCIATHAITDNVSISPCVCFVLVDASAAHWLMLLMSAATMSLINCYKTTSFSLKNIGHCLLSWQLFRFRPQLGCNPPLICFRLHFCLTRARRWTFSLSLFSSTVTVTGSWSWMASAEMFALSRICFDGWMSSTKQPLILTSKTCNHVSCSHFLFTKTTFLHSPRNCEWQNFHSSWSGAWWRSDRKIKKKMKIEFGRVTHISYLHKNWKCELSEFLRSEHNFFSKTTHTHHKNTHAQLTKKNI